MSKILIIGLSGSGKSTLATALATKLNYHRINADKVRKEANDWDFSPVGRMRQAQRVANKAKEYDMVVIDMIAPLKLHRAVIKPDILIWMDTVKSSKYADTDNLFEPPTNADIILTSYDYDLTEIIEKVLG